MNFMWEINRGFLWYMIYNIFGLSSHIKHRWDETHCKWTNSYGTLWSQILLFNLEEQQLADGERLQINLVLLWFTYILWCSDEGFVDQKLRFKVNFNTDLNVQISVNFYINLLTQTCKLAAVTDKYMEKKTLFLFILTDVWILLFPFTIRGQHPGEPK